MTGNTRLGFLPLFFIALSSCIGPSSEPGRGEGADQKAWRDQILRAEDARDPGDPILAEALKSEDASIRRAALRALGRIGSPRAIPVLVTAVAREPSPELRGEGIFALGLIGNVSLVDNAGRFLLDPSPEVRATLMRSLGMVRDPRAFLTLLDALQDPDPGVRGDAALALARIFSAGSDPLKGRSFGAFNIIGLCLTSDPVAEVRWRCAYALSRLGVPETRKFLLAAITDDDPRVRLYCAVGLGVLSPQSESREALLLAVGDPDWRVVVAAVKSLASDSDPGVAEVLIASLGAPQSEGHPSHHVRAAAAETLGQWNGEVPVADALQAALGDTATSVRAYALDSLATKGSPERVRAYLDELWQRGSSGQNIYLLSRATRAAAALPDNHGLPFLAKCIASSEVPIRTAALASTGKYRQHIEDVRPYLVAALAERDVALVEAAARSAMELSDRALLPDLEQAFRNSSGPELLEARVALLEALATLGGADAAPLLRRALGDEEPQIRRASRAALARIGETSPTLPLVGVPERITVPRFGIDYGTGGEKPRVKVVTNQGVILLELDTDEAPHHATVFLERCRQGFYDALTFHRMVPGFVVQGLDPRGDGYGTGGGSLRSEVNMRRYGRGVLGMPDAGLDSGGCQIFITFGPVPRLDSRYTVFGNVVEGMDVVDRLDVGDYVEYVVAPPQIMESPHESRSEAMP